MKKLTVFLMVLMSLGVQGKISEGGDHLKQGISGGNGSDQQGQAIPLELDRGIKLQSLMDAQSTCLKEGFSEFVKIALPEGKSEPYCKTIVRRLNDKHILGSRCSSYRIFDERIVFQGAGYSHRVPDADSFTVREDRNLSLPQISARSGVRIPQLVFEIEEDKIVYDAFGQKIEGESIATNISVKTFGKESSLVNVETGFNVGLSYNSEDYKLCLEREIFNAL